MEELAEGAEKDTSDAHAEMPTGQDEHNQPENSRDIINNSQEQHFNDQGMQEMGSDAAANGTAVTMGETDANEPQSNNDQGMQEVGSDAAAIGTAVTTDDMDANDSQNNTKNKDGSDDEGPDLLQQNDGTNSSVGKKRKRKTEDEEEMLCFCDLSEEAQQEICEE
ncbi:hypothetical protein AX17_006783 [Amanita inopinata Kibby_2008]|nr:hypothetical protein AX17_006783 [Amanita inopinata Kibby_2008]